MKKILSALALGCAMSITILAHADTGFINAGVNLRAGPGTQFPRITTISRGVRVDVRGCIASRQWCDVAFQGGRGWVSARHLDL